MSRIETLFDEELSKPAIRTRLRLAAQNYRTGVLASFVEAGNDPDIRERLCDECPMRDLCGPVAKEITSDDKGGNIPTDRIPLLETYGIVVSNDGDKVCPKRLVRYADQRIRTGAFILEGEDPLRGLPQETLVTDTLLYAATDVKKRVTTGQRI